MINSRVANLLILSLLILFHTGCKKDRAYQSALFVPGPCIDSVSFQSEVMPQIIIPGCQLAGCHDATAAGGIVYSNHSEVSANTHPMYVRLIHDLPEGDLHLDQPILADSLLQKFYCWIQQGRPDN